MSKKIIKVGIDEYRFSEATGRWENFIEGNHRGAHTGDIQKLLDAHWDAIQPVPAEAASLMEVQI